MLIVETFRKIRCAYHRKKIRQIAREFNLSKNTVKKVIRGDATEFSYDRTEQPLPKLGPYQEYLSGCLAADSIKPGKQQRTAVVLFEDLQRQGFEGGYGSVRRYVKLRKDEGGKAVTAYIPQSFDPGEAFQFDWSLTGVTNWLNWACRARPSKKQKARWIFDTATTYRDISPLIAICNAHYSEVFGVFAFSVSVY